MVRLHISARQTLLRSQQNEQQSESQNSKSSNRSQSNSALEIRSTSSSLTSLNSNVSSLEQQQQPLQSGGVVMVVPEINQPQQPQTSQQQYPPDGSLLLCSLPSSPPLLQHTPTPPQSAQIVPPVCAVHHPQQHQQLAIVAAMHQTILQTASSQIHTATPQAPGTSLAKLQQHAQDSGNSLILSSDHASGLSPSGSTSSSVGSSTSNSGCVSGGGASVGSTVITAANAPPPSGPLFIQYPSELFSAEYYIAPHPHEGICPQHPHHHHQPLCPMPTEYGPTTVQMVSQNRPTTLPVSVQLGPHGQAVMQQYMNEGTLTHVVLTTQQYQQLHTGPGHIHTPFLTTNGTSHFISPIPTAFQAAAAGAGPTHFHAMSGSHLSTQSSPAAQPSQLLQSQRQLQQPSSMSHSQLSPTPPSSYHKDERSLRQHTKLLRKLEKQRDSNSVASLPAHLATTRRGDLNGYPKHASGFNANSGTNQNNQNVLLAAQLHDMNDHNYHNMQRINAQNCSNVGYTQYQTVSSIDKNVTSVGTSDDGEDIAEDEEVYQASIVEQLSAIQKPKVCDLTSRSAKIVWEAPAINDTLFINKRDLRFNVLLSDRAKECKYKSLYKGESFECIVQDLQPGQQYVVRLQVHFEKLQGTPSEPAEFTTPACEPDQPLPPKLSARTKNTLHLRWNSPNANGALIQQYLLEYDEGKTTKDQPESAQFVEIVRTKNKQCMLSKLQPSTNYYFRLAAVNDIGTSVYSPICNYSTCGNPPTAPKPPTLQTASSSTLRLIWERRNSDLEFVLQMLDRSTGHGYLNVYNGSNNSYECCHLQRATVYQFRLRTKNEAGHSPWSSEVSFNTQPERPGRPGKPHVKGKIHGTYFKVRWDPPLDTGGAEISRYLLELTSGSKFGRVYFGAELETVCVRLHPGTTYQLRVACEGPIGLSDYSEVAHLTTEAIVPAAPPPPYYDNPPGPYAAVLHLSVPDYTGGAPILEFEVQLRQTTLTDGANQLTTPESIYRGKEPYCVVKDLQPGHTYEVQARTYNRIGAGAWSSWLQFVAASAAPSVPLPPTVVVKSATHLYISWQAPSMNGAPISEYCLESAVVNSQDVESTEEKLQTFTPPSSAFQPCYRGLDTSTDLRSLLPYSIYYFRLNASNVTGTSKWSNLVNAQTPAAVPAAPYIKDYDFTANEVTLRWTQPDDHGAAISAYNIEYAHGLITTPDANTEYTITGLQAETAYKFRVQAINAIGAGPFSANAKLTTLPKPPSAPTLECTGTGHNFVKLKWGDGRNLDFTKFYVEMYVQRAKEFQVVYVGTSCMCKVNKLQERTAYTFRICASTDIAGVGDYSSEYVFNTTATVPNQIKAPRISYMGNACLFGAHGIANNFIPSAMLQETSTSYIAGLGNLTLGVPHIIEWQTSKNTFSDRVEYALQYAIGKDTDFKQLYRGAETKFIVQNLQPGATYQFRVSPIRVTNAGEDILGQIPSALRYTVPQLPPLDDIDSTFHSSTTANMFKCNANNNAAGISGSNGMTACYGHSHNHYHHAHNQHARHSQQQQHQEHVFNRCSQNVSSTAATITTTTTTTTASANKSNNNASNNTVLLNKNAIGLLPLYTAMAGELAAKFAGCDDPNHLHHHHYHNEQDVGGIRQRTASSSSSGKTNYNHNPMLALQPQNYQQQQQNQYNNIIRRYVNKLSTVYTNRKHFSDQEKAVLFMISFLFFTFLFATIVKMFIR